MKLSSLFPFNLHTSFSQRGILLAVAIVLMALVLFRLGMQAYSEHKQYLDQQIALKEMKYDNYLRVIRKSKDYSSLTASLEKFKEGLVAKRFIWNDIPSLSETRLQNIIKELANKTRVNVRITKVLPRKTIEGFTLLQVRINCRAEIGAIRDFLLQVQDNPLYIFFNKVEIKPVSRSQRRYYYLNAELSALTNPRDT